MVELSLYASHGGRKSPVTVVTVHVASLFLPASGDCLITYEGPVWC